MIRCMTAPLVSPFRHLFRRVDSLVLRPRGVPDQHLLTPLLGLVQPAPPPPDLLPRIELELGAEPQRTHAFRLRLAGVWMLGAATGAAAVVALIPVSLDRAQDTKLPLSVISGAERVAMLSARTLAEGRYLRVDHFGLQAATDRSLELWLLHDGSGHPLSLGLLAAGANVTVIPLAGQIASGDVLAVSDEALGGSAGPGPSGPVIVAARVGAEI